jgi:hypothetical protein
MNKFEEFWKKMWASSGENKNGQLEIIDIPFLSLQIDKNNFHNLWLSFFKLFLNENPASADLIIDSNKQKIISCILNKSTKEGLIGESIPIEISKLSVKMEDLKDIENAYEKIRVSVKKNYQYDIGNVRIMNTDLLEKFSQTFEEIESNTKQNFLQKIGEILQILIESISDQSLVLYPESIGLTFLTRFQSFLGNFSYSGLFSFISYLFPKKEYTLTLNGTQNGKPWYLSYLFNISKTDFQMSYIPNLMNESVQNTEIEQDEAVLNYLIGKYKLKHNYMIEAESLVNYLRDVFLSPIPLESKRAKLLFEKLLYRYKKVDKFWNFKPKPAIFTEGYRFVQYLMGTKINPGKISYWSIPEIIEVLFNKMFGLAGKFIIIVNQTFSKKINQFQALLTYQNGSITDMKILPIDEIELITEKATNQAHPNPLNARLGQIRMKLSEKYGYIGSAIWISGDLFKSIISNVGFDFHSKNYSPLKNIISVVKDAQDRAKFTINPENAIYSSLMNQPPKALLKNLLPILTDLNEF